MANPFPVTFSGAPRNPLTNKRFAPLVVLMVAILATLLAGCSGGKKSIEALMQDLKSANAGVRQDALRELETRGPEANIAIPAVAELLHDSLRDVRYRAAKVLSKIGADSTAVAELTNALKDPDVEIRYYVAKTLSVIGPEAAPAVPNMVAALKEKGHEKSYHYLIKALKKVGPGAVSAVPALKELSQHGDENLRHDVAAALKSIQET